MKATLNKWVPRMIGAQINITNLFSGQAAGEKAFQTFCTPRRGRIRPKDQDFLKSCQSEAMLATGQNGVKAYSWNDAGKDTVLLLHGWESNAARWSRLITLLVKEGYRVVAIDAPGHGASEGDLFNIPYYAEGINSAVQTYQPSFIAGHSVGGASLLYFMSHYARPSVRGTVIMGAPSELSPVIDGFKSILGLSDGSIQSLERVFQTKFNHTSEYFSSQRFARAIEIPSLVIHDEEDKVCPLPDGQAIYNHLPEAELFVTKGLGHGLQDKRVYDRIIEFCGQVPDAGRFLVEEEMVMSN